MVSWYCFKYLAVTSNRSPAKEKIHQVSNISTYHYWEECCFVAVKELGLLLVSLLLWDVFLRLLKPKKYNFPPCPWLKLDSRPGDVFRSPSPLFQRGLTRVKFLRHFVHLCDFFDPFGQLISKEPFSKSILAAKWALAGIHEFLQGKVWMMRCRVM